MGGLRRRSRTEGRRRHRPGRPQQRTPDPRGHRPHVERHRQRGRRRGGPRPRGRIRRTPPQSPHLGKGRPGQPRSRPAPTRDRPRQPHYFDDAACVRACVLAVAHPGDPQRAAALAEFDAHYTQDGDGVHGARAMAAALSLALVGTAVDDCVSAALAELPEATEIGRNARHALKLARDSDSAFALIPSWNTRSSTTSTATASRRPKPSRWPWRWRRHPGAVSPKRSPPRPVSPASPTPPQPSWAPSPERSAAAGRSRNLAGRLPHPLRLRPPRLTGTDLVELAELLEATQPAPPGG